MNISDIERHEPIPAASLTLNLKLTDLEVLAELEACDSETERDELAAAALKIGLLTLRNARGQVDSDHLRGVLQEYFDSDTGRFHELAKRFVGEGGEIEQALKRMMEEEGSTFAETLEGYLGEDGILNKQLDPEDPEGALGALAAVVEGAMTESRDSFLNEFSLDNDKGLFVRLLAKLDEEREKDRKQDEGARVQLIEAIGRLEGKSEERDRSTRHGEVFEKAVLGFLEDRYQSTGNLVTDTGHIIGLIPDCKVGDCVLELGVDHVAAGSRVVVEAKQKKSSTLKKASDEIKRARKNRDATHGVFVFSKRSAPDGLEGFKRLGQDIFVVWDAEDEATDVCLMVAMELACCMAVLDKGVEVEDVDLVALEGAVSRLVTVMKGFEEIIRVANLVRRHGKSIVDSTGSMRDDVKDELAAIQVLLGSKRS